MALLKEEDERSEVFLPLYLTLFLVSSFTFAAEGYAAFQEDSSADEAESPSKMKRSKGIHVFKKPSFSKKKEKDFKVKEKGPKEDKAKDKKSKDLTAADVVKQWKEKKKKKKPATEVEPVPVETPTFRPVFGAPLAEAVKRTALYDGIQLPAIFRECVDYIESYGMKCEGIYRVSGIQTGRLLTFSSACKKRLYLMHRNICR